MLSSAPSPNLHSSLHNRSHYESTRRAPSRTIRLSPRSAQAKPAISSGSKSPVLHIDDDYLAPPRMVDAGTQYSPPAGAIDGADAVSGGTSLGAQKELHTALDVSDTQMGSPTETQANVETPKSTSKRNTMMLSEDVVEISELVQGKHPHQPETSSNKRRRQAAPDVHLMPLQYETCNPRDLVLLISLMLMDLIRHNDAIPLEEDHLTRFHSRAPPTISVQDYLQRLTTHATLSPPILLSMVYYIDRLCALYPQFTITSLTVHRFLITSATVASKGLSDSFWTNKTYAKVGGVTLKELALLELEFLRRVEWRIVPKPEVLVDYYKSLVERSEGYEIDVGPGSEEISPDLRPKEAG